MAETFSHVTVLLKEAVDGLNIKTDGTYIDGTFGRGGHSREILSRLGPDGRLFGIDRDPQAVQVGQQLQQQDPRFTIIHGPFSGLAEYLEQRDLVGRVDGVLLDLGVSSPQLDDAERGFSFLRDGPLDMRMDNTQGETASQWLHRADAKDIAWVIRTFGEDKYAGPISRAIKAHIEEGKPLQRTRDLAKLIEDITPKHKMEKGKHPATRTFQAVRIYINSELEEIEQALKGSLVALAPQGRLSIISFHSLEDRMVKRFMRRQSQGEPLPPGLPLTEEQINKTRTMKTVGKALKPSDGEVTDNTRSRSSVLRVAERLG